MYGYRCRYHLGATSPPTSPDATLKGEADMPNDSDQAELTYDVRLRKLERENTWMKRAGIGIAVLFALIMLFTRTRNFEKVNAGEFDLKDSSGQIRARLAVLPDGPGLELYAASGEKRVALAGGGERANLSLYLPATASPSSTASINLYQDKQLIASMSGGPSSTDLRLHSAKGTGDASLTVASELAAMGLDGNPAEGSGLALEAGGNTSCLKARSDKQENSMSGAAMCVDSEGHPSVELGGLQGHKAIVGVAPLGEQQPGKIWGSSAASLALVGEKGKVLWSAPH
jgi:hypothetical protein